LFFFVGCCGNSVVGRILEVKDFLLGEGRGEERRRREEERFGEMGSLQKLGNG
jgi:hypothetical protein